MLLLFILAVLFCSLNCDSVVNKEFLCDNQVVLVGILAVPCVCVYE